MDSSFSNRSVFQPVDYGISIQPMLVFFLGIFFPLQFGSLPLGIPICIGLFCLLVPTYNNQLRDKVVVTLLFFCVWWACSQLASDLILKNSTGNLVRGLAKIIFTGICICSLTMYLDRVAKVKLFVVGYCLGRAAYIIAFPNDQQSQDLWKFGFGFCMILGGSFLLMMRNGESYVRQYIFFWIMGLLSIYLGSRSMGAISILSGTVLFIKSRQRFGSGKILRRKIILAMGIVGVLILGVYSSLAKTGYLGERAQAKYISQTMGDKNLISSGRVDVIVGIIAALDKPFLGHGSWARGKKYRRLISTKPAYLAKNDRIPSHSHLVGAWVEGGILSTAFFLVAGIIILKMLYTSLARNSIFDSAFVFMGMMCCWDILFSPYGSAVVPIFSLSMVIMIVINKEVERSTLDNLYRSNNSSRNQVAENYD